MHLRTLLMILFVFCLAIPVSAQQEGAEPQGKGATLQDRVRQDPNDTQLINQYVGTSLRDVFSKMQQDPDAALKLVDDVQATLDSLKPESQDAKQLVARAKSALEFYRQRIALQKTSIEELVQKLNANPADTKAIALYRDKILQQASGLFRSQPDKAAELLDEAKQLLESLREKTKGNEDVASAIEQTQAGWARLSQAIELQKTSIEELVQKLNANPANTKTIALYGAKIAQAASAVVRSDIDKAEELLKDAKQLLEALQKKSEGNEEVAKAIEQAESGWTRLEQTIAAEKKLKELIGQDAAKLAVDVWVNGDPLTDEDLKGKVVLLDFWAVWCGPCVSTFPHLIEWNKEYADKGLIIIGLTNYYGMVWDEDTKNFKRAEKPSEEAENEMLEKFAEQHKLTHRFGVCKERTMAEYYGVTGIPEVVVIDRHGKIRLIKVGSGPANTAAIQKMLEELLAEKG
jgi:thiol-disulfide isomerase/thioredoxin